MLCVHCDFELGFVHKVLSALKYHDQRLQQDMSTAFTSVQGAGELAGAHVILSVPTARHNRSLPRRDRRAYNTFHD